MNPERLLQHFERISEAPDAILRLRRFILDLAVRGKLVEQDPDDEPATELLKRIQAEKARLRREGLIANEKSSLTVLSTELPFAILGSWQCARFIDYAIDISTGPFGSILHQSDYVEGGIPLVNPSHMVNGRIVPEQNVAVSRETGKRLSAYKLRAGDLVMARRGEVGRAAVVYGKEDGWLCGTGSFFLRFTEEVCREYLMVLLRCEFIRNYLAGEAVGITMVNLNHGILKRMPLPIPPLAEQHRIVAKVDELMALCDQLEAAKTEREQSRDRLVVASLHRLNSPADTAETDAPDLPVGQADAFRDHARFVFNHLSRLTTRPEHIKQLRQTILNLAVRGKLVPQDPNDEPASSQLALNDYARKTIAQKDRRADSGLQQLLVPEEKWEIPPSWEWRAVADIVLFIDYRGKTPSKVGQGIRLITAKNVRKGFVSLSPEEFLSESNYREWMTRGIPQEGDVLFTTEAPMGNAAVVRLKERFALAQRIINFRSYGALDPDFLVLQMLAEPFQSILDKTATGLTAKGIKAAKLKRLPIAIPPLAEQHRIVARVDELMALCDQLEAQLTATEADSCRLLEAVLHEALAPEPEKTA